jgi:hypothetical protein
MDSQFTQGGKPLRSKPTNSHAGMAIAPNMRNTVNTSLVRTGYLGFGTISCNPTTDLVGVKKTKVGEYYPASVFGSKTTKFKFATGYDFGFYKMSKKIFNSKYPISSAEKTEEKNAIEFYCGTTNNINYQAVTIPPGYGFEVKVS